MQLQIISQSLGTLHPDQNGFLQLRAEAHCQPVCPCARPVIGWPGICDEGSASPEDVSCPSCKTQIEDGHMGVIIELHNNKRKMYPQTQIQNTFSLTTKHKLTAKVEGWHLCTATPSFKVSQYVKIFCSFH